MAISGEKRPKWDFGSVLGYGQPTHVVPFSSPSVMLFFILQIEVKFCRYAVLNKSDQSQLGQDCPLFFWLPSFVFASASNVYVNETYFLRLTAAFDRENENDVRAACDRKVVSVSQKH